jgi:hypothetical protein
LAKRSDDVELLQELWGGYGSLSRRRTPDGMTEIVKDVRWPSGKGDLSHRRKLRSYQVEAHWYRHWAGRVPDSCRIAALRGVQSRPDGMLLVLEDLDAAGYARRSSSLRRDDLHAAVDWLARFHAAFLGAAPEGLWKEGSYWHLGTRPDEWKAMPTGPLREAAAEIDRRLAGARFRTIVHGDAKPDNFCLGAAGSIAAVDFQYVGGGCGMRDLAYLLDDFRGGILDDSPTRAVVDRYFATLRHALRHDPLHGPQADAIEQEWRDLFPVAWLDFQRFLQGWSPAFRRPSPNLERAIRAELERLDR